MAATRFIAGALGQRFVESVPLTLAAAWGESLPRTPLICLLSPGEWEGKPSQLVLHVDASAWRSCALCAVF